jgi:hypothetical protein
MQIISSSITRYHGGGCETGGFKDADPIRSEVHGKENQVWRVTFVVQKLTR